MFLYSLGFLAGCRNCLLVRQSFFRKDSRYVELGGGVRGCQGFYSSFRPTQSGLSLNVGMFIISRPNLHELPGKKFVTRLKVAYLHA